jgi:outer membrane lipoprotein carrier protein
VGLVSLSSLSSLSTPSARLRWLLTASLVTSTFAPWTRAAESSAAQLTQALQLKYDSIKDFSADFVQTYRGGVLRKQLTERGHVLIKKPGKMRWEYEVPEKKLFVSDGVKLYSYVPADNQVIVTSVPEGDRAGAPVLFLAGKGNLMRDFTPENVGVPPGFPPQTRAVKLVPKVPQADYDSLILVVDQPSLMLRGIVTLDAQGGQSAISFANLKENVGTPDKVFAFSIPRGAEVITDATTR